jgi:hypothetical protein
MINVPIKVIDFGTATYYTKAKRTKNIVGTLSYMSP